MARPLRIQYPGAVYHITSRGNAKERIFLSDGDRANFLLTLKKVIGKYNWLCYAYCLMDNHYHLIIETPDGNLAIGMRQLNGVYTQSFNSSHKRLGHIFQGRYKAILIQKGSHLLEALRYVVLNPLRAGIVKNPEKYIWSSYRSTAGLEKPSPFLSTEWVLAQFGRRKSIAQRRYKEFVLNGVRAASPWDSLKGQILLGDDEFVVSALTHLKNDDGLEEIPRSQRFAGRPSLKALFASASSKEKRDKKIEEAVIKYSYRQNEIALYLGLHYSTVSRIMKKESIGQN